MIDSLNRIGYTVNYKVLNAKDFDVPQNRERIVLVGNFGGKFFDFDKIAKTPSKSMKEYLDLSGEFEYLNKTEYTILENSKTQINSGLNLLVIELKK
jgi:DNA (cytosine-5)-methyltransferase 1